MRESGGAPRDHARAAGSSRDEDESDRLDRELIELLNELRVALPGVQVLFAFLLTVPVSQRFGAFTSLQRGVFFATFLAATASTALLMIPSAYHRVRWRQADKERLLRTSNVAAIAGLVGLAVAISGVVFLISDLMFHSVVASVVTAIVAAAYAGLWFVLPLARRLEDGGSTTDA
jgi:uncharacterized protein DUF6328